MPTEPPGLTKRQREVYRCLRAGAKIEGGAWGPTVNPPFVLKGGLVPWPGQVLSSKTVFALEEAGLAVLRTHNETATWTAPTDAPT